MLFIFSYNFNRVATDQAEKFFLIFKNQTFILIYSKIHNQKLEAKYKASILFITG